MRTQATKIEELIARRKRREEILYGVGTVLAMLILGFILAVAWVGLTTY